MQDYPKHLHKANGEYRVVSNDEERDVAKKDGWQEQPVLEGPATTDDSHHVFDQKATVLGRKQPYQTADPAYTNVLKPSGRTVSGVAGDGDAPAAGGPSVQDIDARFVGGKAPLGVAVPDPNAEKQAQTDRDIESGKVKGGQRNDSAKADAKTDSKDSKDAGDEFGDLSAKDAIAQAEQSSDADGLKAALKNEDRVTVQDAMKARIKELSKK